MIPFLFGFLSGGFAVGLVAVVVVIPRIIRLTTRITAIEVQQKDRKRAIAIREARLRG
jgi:hypothetical protein